MKHNSYLDVHLIIQMLLATLMSTFFSFYNFLFALIVTGITMCCILCDFYVLIIFFMLLLWVISQSTMKTHIQLNRSRTYANWFPCAALLMNGCCKYATTLCSNHRQSGLIGQLCVCVEHNGSVQKHKENQHQCTLFTVWNHSLS